MTFKRSRVDPARLLKALAFAADKHRDQRRKNAEASPANASLFYVIAAIAAASFAVSTTRTHRRRFHNSRHHMDPTSTVAQL